MQTRIHNLFIGIDVGSTAIKLGLVNTEGKLISYFNSPYSTKAISEDHVEQDPNDWIKLILKGLTEFQNKNPGCQLSGLSMCSQVNTHIFVDENGEALLPAIFWQDTRAKSEAQEIDSKISDEQKISWWGTPMPIDASHVISRMLWVKKNKPDVWAKTKYVMLPKDYCIFKLSGEIVSDPLSNIGLVDNNLKYIDDLLSLVSGAPAKLPPLKKMTEQVGVIKKEFPFYGTKIINGTMDAWIGILGSGGFENKKNIYLSGTSEILGINSKEVIPTPGIIIFPEDENIKLHAGPTQSGGASKLWFCNLFNLTPLEMNKLVENENFNDVSPIFLPHLQGERAPLWNPNLKGIFYGMNSKTNKGNLARSVYEGVSFSAKLILESLEKSSNCINEEINCGGGGFQADIWNQIRANILNKKINRLSIKDPGILGSVGIAGYGSGIFSNIDEAFNKMTSFDKFYEPDQTTKNYYSDFYEIFKNITESNIKISEKFSKFPR